MNKNTSTLFASLVGSSLAVAGVLASVNPAQAATLDGPAKLTLSTPAIIYGDNFLDFRTNGAVSSDRQWGIAGDGTISSAEGTFALSPSLDGKAVKIVDVVLPGVNVVDGTTYDLNLAPTGAATAWLRIDSNSSGSLDAGDFVYSFDKFTRNTSTTPGGPVQSVAFGGFFQEVTGGVNSLVDPTIGGNFSNVTLSSTKVASIISVISGGLSIAPDVLATVSCTLTGGYSTGNLSGVGGSDCATQINALPLAGTGAGNNTQANLGVITGTITIPPTAVPEPSASAAFLVLGGLAATQLKKRKKA